MVEAMKRVVRIITESQRFYFLIAIVIFFSGVFVRGGEYYFPWMLSWMASLFMAICLPIPREIIEKRKKGKNLDTAELEKALARLFFLIAILTFLFGEWALGLENIPFAFLKDSLSSHILWWVLWVVPLLVAIYFLKMFINHRAAIIKDIAAEKDRIKAEKDEREEREARWKKNRISTTTPSRYYGERCIMCGQQLTSPGLYLDNGDGPYGPKCAAKARRRSS